MTAKKNEKIDILDELAKQLPIFGEKDYETKVEPISSGSLSLNFAIGIGGYPRGAIVDVFGNESAGKSLLSIMAIAEIQKKGGVAVVWDAERSYSKNLSWMRVNGVDTTKIRFLKLSAKQGAEVGFDAIERICKAGAADLIVIDSVPSLIPQVAIDKNMTEVSKLGARASMLTEVLPKLAGFADESKILIMFINQMRCVIGGGMYGPTEKETSIFALKHFSSLRLSVRKINKSMKEQNGVPVSHRVHVKVVKNKVAAPYRQAEFEINYLKGVDNISEIAEILIAADIIKKKAAWFEYEGKRFHGMNQIADYFKDKKVFEKGLERAKNLKINSFGILEEGIKEEDYSVEE